MLQKKAFTVIRDHQTNPNRVFVVHGRHIGYREALARMLERFGVAVVILDEQPEAARGYGAEKGGICYRPERTSILKIATLFGHLASTEDMKEGMKAFREKRPAEFRNR